MTEDPPPASASRRSPWTSRTDRLIAAGLTVVVLAAAALIWVTSDSAATDATTAEPPKRMLTAPERIPPELSERWRAPSPGTPVPVADGGTVVTGADGRVVGRNAENGQTRWYYQRDLPLCTVGGAWDTALAVYRNGDRCSEVTQLDPDTGQRTAQRNGDAEEGTRLLSDGSHVVTTGTRLINIWSPELIKVMEYGDVPAPVNPGMQPRTGCTYTSMAVDEGRLAILEHCPDERAERLTVIATTNERESDNSSEQPDELFSTTLTADGARVVAVAGGDDPLTAVAFAETDELVVYDRAGEVRSKHQLDLPPDDLAGAPDGGAVQTTRGSDGVYWYTGSATIALDSETLEPEWTLRGTRGAPVEVGAELLSPIDGGLSVTNPRDGSSYRTVSVPRGDYAGDVRLGSLGPMLLEQRGDTLVALR